MMSVNDEQKILPKLLDQDIKHGPILFSVQTHWLTKEQFAERYKEDEQG